MSANICRSISIPDPSYVNPFFRQYLWFWWTARVYSYSCSTACASRKWGHNGSRQSPRLLQQCRSCLRLRARVWPRNHVVMAMKPNRRRLMAPLQNRIRIPPTCCKSNELSAVGPILATNCDYGPKFYPICQLYIVERLNLFWENLSVDLYSVKRLVYSKRKRTSRIADILDISTKPPPVCSPSSPPLMAS